MQNTSAHTPEAQVGQTSGTIIRDTSVGVKEKLSDRDQSYLQAISAGDMQTAQKMFVEAFADASDTYSKVGNLKTKQSEVCRNEIIPLMRLLRKQ